MLLPADHLGSVLSGERIVLPAWQEQPHSIEVVGSCALSGGKLHGRKMFVSMAAGVDAFLVTVAGGVALVERDAPGVHVVSTPAQDGGNFATVTFDGAPAEL